MGRDFCPSCGKECDSATGSNNDSVPNPGDITVCFYCASLLKFGSDMALEELPDEEYMDLDVETRLHLAKVQHEIKKNEQ